MNDLEFTKQLKAKLESLQNTNEELLYKLRGHENHYFQMVSREEAVLAALQDATVKAYQVDVSNEFSRLIDDIAVKELTDDVDTFYVIQKK